MFRWANEATHDSQKRSQMSEVLLQSKKKLHMQSTLSSGAVLKRWKTWSKQGCLYCWPTAEWTQTPTVMSILGLDDALSVRETDRSNTSQAFYTEVVHPRCSHFSSGMFHQWPNNYTVAYTLQARHMCSFMRPLGLVRGTVSWPTA